MVEKETIQSGRGGAGNRELTRDCAGGSEWECCQAYELLLAPHGLRITWSSTSTSILKIHKGGEMNWKAALSDGRLAGPWGDQHQFGVYDVAKKISDLLTAGDTSH